MYTYEFVRIQTESNFFNIETASHREIIRQRSEEGWRYAGCIPAKQGGHGIVFEMDLIFEKER